MFLQEDVIKKYRSEYMFIGCIDYINKVSIQYMNILAYVSFKNSVQLY